MNNYFIYNIIFLFIFITSINYLDVSATISDLFFNQIIFNETNMTMTNGTETFKNSTTTNMTMTNGTETFKNSTTGTCVMPECPSGKVCIQVCPESLPNI
ncbi:MAG TPA: hypothetical protein VFM31_12155, partial [Nitrososphaeraceae archaeon]|jgi:hypothetical protein|nr:hypothetical protein [Nitrososphaeraceae archaeon]